MKDVFEAYLAEISYKDWDFNIGTDGDRNYLQVGFWDYDVDHPELGKTYQKGRKWLLSPYMTKSEVIQTAFKAVMTAEEHETRERFTYKNKRIFGPHFNVDVLAEICQSPVLDARAAQVA